MVERDLFIDHLLLEERPSQSSISLFGILRASRASRHVRNKHEAVLAIL